MVNNDFSSKTTRLARKKALVAQRIFDVAMDLFRRQGIDNTSVQQICDHADVAKGTFFNYFATKEHLLLKCHDVFKESMLEHVQAKRFDTAQDAVLCAFQHWSELVTKNPILGRGLLKAVFANELLMQSDQNMSERLYNWMYDKISHDVETGKLKKDLDVTNFISILFNILSATSSEFLTTNDAKPILSQLRSRCDFLFDAVKNNPE